MSTKVLASDVEHGCERRKHDDLLAGSTVATLSVNDTDDRLDAYALHLHSLNLRDQPEQFWARLHVLLRISQLALRLCAEPWRRDFGRVAFVDVDVRCKFSSSQIVTFTTQQIHTGMHTHLTQSKEHYENASVIRHDRTKLMMSKYSQTRAESTYPASRSSLKV